MQPMESVDLERRAVTKRAARGHADLVEQVAGLRALTAAHLVADGDERASLQPGLVEEHARALGQSAQAEHLIVYDS